MPDHAKKLLVADDSLTIQKVIRLALSNEGYDIQAVSDGQDAIEQIALFRPQIVLIDVALPGKDAFEVKREINAQEDLTETRFVLMSSAFEKVDEEQVREVTFHGRLTKPFDPAHLRQVLSSVFNQITEKRMEPTSLIQMPGASVDAPASLGADLWSEGRPGGGPIFPPPPSAVSAPEIEPSGFSPSSFTMDDPVPPPSPSSGDADIKQLTESTIRISGLDDFDWSVQEPAPIPPPPGMSAGDTTLSNMVEFDLPPVAPPAPPASPSRPSIPSEPEGAVSRAELSAVVRAELERAVQLEIQRILPNLAERLVKEEIHRMLSEN